MKPNLVFYRFITFVMLPMAGLLTVNIISALPVALGNPILLFIIFFFFGVVAYTFTSFIFLTKGILNERPQKASLKDWIKVNGYVAIIFAIFLALGALVYLTSPDAQKMMEENFSKIQDAMGQRDIDKATFFKAIRLMFMFYGAYAVLLIVHIIITFRLIKKYVHLFGVQGNSNNTQ